MRCLGTLLAVLLCSGSTLSAQEQTPREVKSAIKDVTVYADRARVKRVGSCTLAQGLSVLAFRELPGWIDDGGVRVSLTPPKGGRREEGTKEEGERGVEERKREREREKKGKKESERGGREEE